VQGIVAEAFGKPALNRLGSRSGAGKRLTDDQMWAPASSSVVVPGDVVGKMCCRLREHPARRSEWQPELIERASQAGLDRLFSLSW